MPDTTYDVAVVGCGPVGVTLAGLLARRGLRVVAIDQATGLFPLPRAAHLDHEIMRVLQELGCADEIAPATIVNPGMDFLTASGDVLLSMRAADPSPSGWPASILFHQPGLETHMRAAAVRAGAELRLGVAVERVTGTAPDDAVAEVHLADGTRVQADFVVACDGARSLVRKQLDIAMDDLAFEEPWLVFDLVLRDGVRPPSGCVLQVCDPARPQTLVPMPPPRFRFEFMLLPGEDADELSAPGRVRELLSSWLDPNDVEVERSAVYTFHGLIAREWRRGRVFLAGDAAHQTPPFLGQGMCAGIRDVANLAWKLDLVLRGGAPLGLLDTYQAEREPHVRLVIGAAVEFGRVICTTDTEVAAQRDSAMLAARAGATAPSHQPALPGLGPGPLLLGGGGALAAQPELGGVRFDELVGPAVAVVARSDALLDSDGARWWRAGGARLLSATTNPGLGALLDHAGADTVVVRPDRYVFAAGATIEVPPPATAALLGRGAP